MTPDQYRSLDHVAVQWGHGRVLPLDQLAMREQHIERRDQILAPEFSYLPSFIVGTRRLATVQRRLARILEGRWPLRSVELPVEAPPISIGMQWRSASDDDAVLRWLRGLLKEAAVD